MRVCVRVRVRACLHVHVRVRLFACAHICLHVRKRHTPIVLDQYTCRVSIGWNLIVH